MSLHELPGDRLVLSRRQKSDPRGDPAAPLTEADLRPANEMKKMAMDQRSRQIQ